MSSHPIDFFHAIVLDLNMPIMDGYETSLRLAQFYDNYDNKPMVYALSADNSEECFEKVAEFPFNYKLEQLQISVEMMQIMEFILK